VPIMPAFVFERRRDIELETGLLLAGHLIVDISSSKKLKGKRQHLIQWIVKILIAQARSGQMPDDAVIYGWPNGRRPDHADDTVGNHELMDRWAETRLRIGIRVDPRDDGMLRLDSDILRQIGLAHGPSGKH
jgi:hypothetical protein